MMIGQNIHMSFNPYPLIKMCMFISQKRLINQLGPFEKPKILIVSLVFHNSFYNPWLICVQRHFPLDIHQQKYQGIPQVENFDL